MKADIKGNLAELSHLSSVNCDARGVAIVKAAEKAAHQLMLWLDYLQTSQATGVADCFLSGTKSAVNEGISCLALGLVRPALHSIRLEIDLSLGWLYFKDHPVEWAKVQGTGEGFKLKTDLLRYLSEHFVGYSTRFGLLRDCKLRTLDDPYRLLSAHVHGQSELAIPQVNAPKDIVGTAKAQDEVIVLLGECTEFICDNFWSVYYDRWASLPNDLRTELNARFKSPEQRATFFA